MRTPTTRIAPAPSRIADGCSSRPAVDDELRDHRIVERRDLVTRRTPVRRARRALPRATQMYEPCRSTAGIRARIFGVDARFDRVTADAHSLLLLRHRLAGGHAQLPFDEIEAGNHLGHRMLDLQPRVHLHEIERAVRQAMNSTVPAPG